MSAFYTTKYFRQAHGLFASNGILFNHESPRRGETFVTRKITKGLTRIDSGLQDCIYMGNINSLRDWGHARDYVEMQWRMLQQEKPEDYVIATGKYSSVREFIELAALELNWEGIKWEGEGIKEIGKRKDTNKIVIRIDEKFFRPSEVQFLLGDAAKAHKELGWKPQTSLRQLVAEMIEVDLKDVDGELIKKGDFATFF